MNIDIDIDMDTYPDMLVAVHFYKSGLQPYERI